MKALISILIGLLVVGCGKKSPSVANKRTNTIPQLEKEAGKPNLRSHVSAGISGQNKSRWHEILGTPQGTIPPDPGGKVIWVSNFDKALAEAKLSKRPILVGAVFHVNSVLNLIRTYWMEAHPLIHFFAVL